MSYGEVQGKTWRSPSVRGLSDSHKLAWAYLLSNQHSNMIGLYVLPIPYMADDLEWTVAQAEAAIAAIEKRGMIVYDRAAQLVFVCRYLKYNQLSRGAREKGAIARLEEMVDSPLLVRLATAVAEWYPLLQELRSYLASRCHEGTLFGVQAVSKRTPAGLLDIDIERAKEEVREQEKEENELTKQADEVIDYLNQQARAKFRHSETARGHIRARLKETATVDDLKSIIDFKCMEWLPHPKYSGFLRPETLFGRVESGMFDGYLAAAIRWEKAGRPIDEKQGQIQRTLKKTEEWMNEGREDGKQESDRDHQRIASSHDTEADSGR